MSILLPLMEFPPNPRTKIFYNVQSLIVMLQNFEKFVAALVVLYLFINETNKQFQALHMS